LLAPAMDSLLPYAQSWLEDNDTPTVRLSAPA
jgi:hypothetical protein